MTSWLGAGLVLPYFGAEIFGIHAIARDAVVSGALDFLPTIEAIRLQPVAMTMFGVGLVLVGASGVLVAVATWRGGLSALGRDPARAGSRAVPAAVLHAPAGRIAHGVLLAVGCWLAAGALRTRSEGDATDRRG
ncbi:hypothetical protein NKG05_20130 [Oerskovia sp. M15]